MGLNSAVGTIRMVQNIWKGPNRKEVTKCDALHLIICRWIRYWRWLWEQTGENGYPQRTYTDVPACNVQQRLQKQLFKTHIFLNVRGHAVHICLSVHQNDLWCAHLENATCISYCSYLKQLSGWLPLCAT